MSGDREDNDRAKEENSQDFAAPSRQASAQEFRSLKEAFVIGRCPVKFEERLIACRMNGDVLSWNTIGEQDYSQELVI